MASTKTSTKTTTSRRQNPKTPVRTRAPLTPSLTAGLGALSLGDSPTKRRTHIQEITGNPFLSRPSSPIKQAINGFVVTAELQRQANQGVVRRGGFESKMDVVKHDYFPDVHPKPSPRRAKSMTRLGPDDRFLPRARGLDDSDIAAAPMKPYHPDGSPRHVARLAEAAGIPLNQRVLKYHEPPPMPSADKDMSQQRLHARILYQRPSAAVTSTGATTNKTRKIPTQPERVLDAPGMVGM